MCDAQSRNRPTIRDERRASKGGQVAPRFEDLPVQLQTILARIIHCPPLFYDLLVG
jgi:hypothetical protein